ncbi:hypothetical protein [Tateyamaria sp. SN3-11]|uniref:hypothetical protein n=1 Tax=Tateyamaria sp. SN3-11 TaxID=3092147 RepID=UPI0039E7D982
MSLIELVVAVLVLSMATVAAFQTMDVSRRAIGGENPRILALQVAANRAEEAKLYGALAARALPDTVPFGPFEWSVATDEVPTEVGLVEMTVTVATPGQPGAVLVVYVPPTPQTSDPPQ